METISACPHHGFNTWMLVNHFYGCMSSAMKQLLETMCGGDFLSKHPDEAMDFLNYVAETSKGWDEPNPKRDGENEALRPPKGRNFCTLGGHGNESKNINPSQEGGGSRRKKAP